MGMENLGEEVASLTQQCNGNGNTPAAEDNNNPPSVTPEQSRNQGGGLLSSTPQRAVGGRIVPPPDESPVVTPRYFMISFMFFIPECCRDEFDGLLFVFVCFFGSGQKPKGSEQGDSPGSLTRSKEVGSITVTLKFWCSVGTVVLSTSLFFSDLILKVELTPSCFSS